MSWGIEVAVKGKAAAVAAVKAERVKYEWFPQWACDSLCAQLEELAEPEGEVLILATSHGHREAGQGNAEQKVRVFKISG